MSSATELSMKDFITMREIALTATFTALVFLSTSLFYIALVSSSGFFNLGEAFVYLAALIGGPIVGAIAGGVGAALADAFLGYGVFAPATLILKGLEGFTTGSLYYFARDTKITIRRLILAVGTIFILFFSIYVTTPVLNGVSESSVVQGSFILADQEHSFNFPGIWLVFIALILCVIIWYVEIFLGEKGKMALSCILAGPIIIVGYFLWEVLVLGIVMDAALFEVPFNIAQVIFGTLIAVPIVAYLEELGILPERSRKEETTETN
ncbi:MAG: ECF transporter S component [Candidatus Hodarchaeota archaeon]